MVRYLSEVPECFLFACYVFYCEVLSVDLLLLRENKDMTNKIILGLVHLSSPGKQWLDVGQQYGTHMMTGGDTLSKLFFQIVFISTDL